MRVVVIGMGVQGEKRRAVAGKDVVATVDPLREKVDYRSLEEVPLSAYDAALLCTPDEAKLGLLAHLLGNGKHVLVEKPLLAGEPAELERLARLAGKSGARCYTAYNHRFEPHFIRMKEVLDSGVLGEVYTVRLFYGNGTARLVRQSPWRDTGAGVLTDLGSHLLDTVLYWFGRPERPFEMISGNGFENRAFDHVVFGSMGRPLLQMEATLLSWRNDFAADVLAEKGSAHIRSLCKWGPARFTLRRRLLPAGRPLEETVTLTRPDPTWAAEYDHFRKLCAGTGDPETAGFDNDLWINGVLADLAREMGAAAV
jgi:predicted dehydrogenase